VPTVVLDFVADQLRIDDPSQVKRYTERGSPGARPLVIPEGAGPVKRCS
jgi:hypothetical protein